MKVPRQFRIDKELLERFDKVNDKLAANGSEVVRRMIEDYTTKKEKELGIMEMKMNLDEVQAYSPMSVEDFGFEKAAIEAAILKLAEDVKGWNEYDTASIDRYNENVVQYFMNLLDEEGEVSHVAEVIINSEDEEVEIEVK